MPASSEATSLTTTSSTSSVEDEGGGGSLAVAAGDIGEKILDPLRSTVFNECRSGGGLCDLIRDHNEVVLTAVSVVGVFFFLSIVPPVFSWSRCCKPDGKKRVAFAFAACVAFYFWLVFLVLNSTYCFGFLAHQGPCVNASNIDDDAVETTTIITTTPAIRGADPSQQQQDVISAVDSVSANARFLQRQSPPQILALNQPPPSSFENASCNGTGGDVLTAHQADLRNLTCTNIVIVVVLLVILVANAKEALNAKALHCNETLCKKEEVRKFLSQLVAKPPEVGHYVTCFHPAKAPDIKTNTSRKVVTFSAIENFSFNSWRDFSDVRLIEPSTTYPIIEIEIVLNFFPGDSATADLYKAFVVQITKEHQGKDLKINIDDYFHLEDQREWTFFIGNPDFIAPWWSRGFPRFLLSCVLLLGWPARMGYGGRIAKHQVEVKKAVFVDSTSQDEGVSLSATPGSSSNETAAAAAGSSQAAASSNSKVEANGEAKAEAKKGADEDDEADATKAAAVPPQPPSVSNPGEPTASPAKMVTKATSPPPTAEQPPHHQHSNPGRHHHHQQQQQGLSLELGRRQNEHLVNAVISNPPPMQQQHFHQQQQQRSSHRQQQQHQQHYHQQQQLYLQQQQQQLFQQHQQLYSAAAAAGVPLPQLPPPQQQQPSSSQHRSSRSRGENKSGDLVTAVTQHHQDVNGVNAVNTIALKDIDVQMQSLSGYETYV